MRVTSLSLSDPYASTHGGTMRTRAFLEAIDSCGVSPDCVFPESGVNDDEVNTGRGLERQIRRVLGPAKRYLLPMPTMTGARNSDIARRIAQSNSEILIVSALSQFPYSKSHLGHTWIDFMDLWSDFAVREADRRVGPGRWTALKQSQVLRNHEDSYARKASVVTVAGWKDHLTLKRRGISSHWLPTPIADNNFDSVPLTVGNDKVAGFIGNFEYWPNRDAFELIKSHWAPELRRLGWRTVVAGRKSHLLPVRAGDGIELMGEVEDVNEFYENVSVTLAPIRLGGGIKVKVIESLAKSRPVIGTSAAFEGFPPEMWPYFGILNAGGSMGEALRTAGTGDVPEAATRQYRQQSLNAKIAELIQECRWSS